MTDSRIFQREKRKYSNLLFFMLPNVLIEAISAKRLVFVTSKLNILMIERGSLWLSTALRSI